MEIKDGWLSFFGEERDVEKLAKPTSTLTCEEHLRKETQDTKIFTWLPTVVDSHQFPL